MKKFFALALALVLALSLCACGVSSPVTRGGGVLSAPPVDFRGRLTTAQEQMKNLRSFRMDMSMDMRMSMNVLGQAMDMAIIADYGIDSEKDPAEIGMDISMDITALGQHQNQKILAYVVQEGSRFITYMSTDGGATWQKEVGDAPDEALQQQSAEQEMQLFLACADSFSESGKMTVNGASAAVYKGELSGDFVGQALESSGSLDALGQLLGSDASPELFRDLGTIPVTVAFDEQSGMMVYYELDMTEAMSRMMQRLMESLLQSYGQSAENMKVEIGVAHISVTLSRFDQVDVAVPAAARAA